MDRFIAEVFLTVHMQTKALKSNMDRFIETHIQIVNVNAFL